MRVKLFFSFALGVIPALLLFVPLTATAYGGAFWAGQERCDTLFETPLPRLPGGSYLTKIFAEEAVQAHYALQQGGKVRLTVREVGKSFVDGETYYDAYDAVIKQKPLQDRIARKIESKVVLADVRTSIGSEFRPMKTEDGAAYIIRPQSLRLTLTAKVRVTDWRQYEVADARNQALWDKYLCVSYHHELGHILVTAQILEESEAEWLALKADTVEALGTKHQALMDEVGTRIEGRQQAYHDALDEMGPALGRSKPYMELPFSWLSPPADSSLNSVAVEP